MNFAESLIWGAAVGLGATLATDAVSVLRQGWRATNGFYRLVGRWLGSIPSSGITHNDIRLAPAVSAEAALGWGAHIILGLIFGIGFVLMFGPTALTSPSARQGLSFGLLTVLVPWFIFQPLFGWGIAVSKLPEPWKLRARSVLTHSIFGLGLWLSTALLKALL